jgi:small subunit ribosomal protein S6
MKEFETTIIFKPDASENVISQLMAKVSASIEKHNGEIFSQKSLGVKKLAYLINKVSKGHYYFIHFASDGGVVREMETMFRLDDRVVRFLTVRLDENVDVAVRKEELAAQEAEFAGAMSGTPTEAPVEEVASV